MSVNKRFSVEQQETVNSISKTLEEGQHRELFNALAECYPEPMSQAALAKKYPRWRDAAIGGYNYKLKEKLKRFYETSDGISADWLIEVDLTRGRVDEPHGYHLTFAKPNGGFYLRRFWRSYLNGNRAKPGVPAHVSYATLRFFRHLDKRFFFRHLDINDDTDSAAVSKLAQEVPALAAVLNNQSLDSAITAGPLRANIAETLLVP